MNHAVILTLILLMTSSQILTQEAHVYGSDQNASSNASGGEHPGAFSSSDPLQIFLYVRNNFVYEPYYGYMKGVNGTLNAGSGNDYDQAAALVYLLRQANIKARYVNGKISLTMDGLENWLGVESSGAALKLLDQSGVPYQTQSDGAQTLIQIEHVWAEAYLNGAWVPMDPSFKQYDYHKSVMIYPPGVPPLPMPKGTAVGSYGVAGIDTGQILRTVESIRAESARVVADLNYTYPLAYRTIVPVQDFSVASKLQAKGGFDDIPDSATYYVEVTIPSFDFSVYDFMFAHNVSARYPTTSLSESRVSLYFAPADEETLKYMQSFPNGLEDDKLDLGKVWMRPVLRLNSAQGIVGDPMPLGYFMPLNVRVLLGGRVACEECAGQFFPQVGTWNSVLINTGDNLDDTVLEGRIAQFRESILALGHRDVLADDVFGALFDMQGRTFFDMVDMQSLRMQSNFEVRSVHTVDVALTGFRYKWVQTGNALHLRWAGSSMDWQIVGWQGGVSSIGNANSELVYNLMWGGMTSYLEGQIIHVLYQTGPVSSGTLLEAANEQGIPIFIVDKNNWNVVSPQLSLSQILMNQLEDAVYGGWTVIVPQHEVTTTSLAMTLSENTALQPTQFGTYVGTPWIQFDRIGRSKWRITSQSLLTSNGGASGTTTPAEYYAMYNPPKPPPKNKPVPSWLVNILSTDLFPYVPDKYHQIWNEAMGGLFWHGALELGGVLLVGAAAGFTVPAVAAGVLIAGTALIIYDLYKIGKEAYKISAEEYEQHRREAQNNLDSSNVESRAIESGASLNAQSQQQSWLPTLPLSAASWTAHGSLLSVLGGSAGSVRLEAGSDSYYPRMLVGTLDLTFLEQYNLDAFLATIEETFLAGSADGRSASAFGMYLADENGHVSGFDPLTDATHLEVNYVYQFDRDGNATAPQHLGLWTPAPGDYSLVVSGATNQDLHLTINAYPLTRSQDRTVQVPRGTSVAVPLSISYSNGTLRASLGDPVPAAFIRLQEPADRTIRGQLVDSHLTGLSGEKVDLFYQSPLNGTAWTRVDSVTTAADGGFTLNWDNAPPGETTVMAAFGRARAFARVSVGFPVTARLLDMGGEPLTDREVTITANNKTASSMMHDGSVTFEAYPGYNVMSADTLVKTVVYTPAPCNPITVQLNIQAAATTSTAGSTSSTLTAPTSLPSAVILAAAVLAMLLIAGAVIIRKRTKRG